MAALQQTFIPFEPQVDNIVSVNHILSEESQKHVLKVMENMFVFCDYCRFHPRVSYLTLSIWLKCIFLSKVICKEYSLTTILLGCFRIASSYCSENVRMVRTLRRFLTIQHLEHTPKKEIHCASSIITLLQGKIWTPNVGDLRHLYFSKCKSSKWNRQIDQIIFSVILSQMADSFEIPDLYIVIQRSLYQFKLLSDINKTNVT
jgi:hypothetical protein